jgi:dTDP-4-dehydrorhamnose reductase
LNNRIFLFGTSGLLGSKIYRFAKDCTVYGSYNLRPGEGIKLDVLNFYEVEKVLDKIKPDVIINTCALSNVDYCEKNPKETKKTNIDFVKKLCRRDEKIVHISSDLVFNDSKNTSYLETDETDAINLYGQSKLDSEKIVQENPNNLIVRASVLYGWINNNLPSSSLKPNNFGKWLIDELNSEKKVRIVSDELSTPILSNDCARSIMHLINNDCTGIYHSAPKESYTRYDFAVKIAEKFDLNPKLITSVTTKELGRDVKTILNKCLNSDKLSNTGFKFQTVDNAIKEFKEEVFRCY